MHTLFRTYVVIGVGSEILKKGGTKLLHQKRGATKSGVREGLDPKGPRAARARQPPRDSAVHRTRATTPVGGWGRGPFARHEGPWRILWSSYSRGCSVFVHRGGATPTKGGHAGGPPDAQSGLMTDQAERKPRLLRLPSPSGGTPCRLTCATWQKGRPTDPGASGPHAGFRSRHEGGGAPGSGSGPSRRGPGCRGPRRRSL